MMATTKAKRTGFHHECSTSPSFNINLEIDSIKPFSNINVSNFVNIYLDNDKKAIFEANVNNDICIISIYNDILTLVSNE